MPRPKHSEVVQLRDARSHRYVKIDQSRGVIVAHKRSPGPYTRIPIVENERHEPWQVKRPGFHLRVRRGVTPRKRAAVCAFLAWYRSSLPPSHHVVVEVYACRRFAHRDDAFPSAIGLFWSPHNPANSRYSPKVYVAGRSGRLVTTLHTLAHELAHYEEWRRTGRTTERGKNRRADALLRRFRDQRVIHNGPEAGGM